MIFVKNPIHQLLKIGNLWINIQMQFGIFNGFPKAKEEKDKL
jgi:hypothetical protein